MRNYNIFVCLPPTFVNLMSQTATKEVIFDLKERFNVSEEKNISKITNNSQTDRSCFYNKM